MNSAILEVIIGMIFVFSLLSILVTQINNVISDALRLRPHHLRDGIDDLITDPILRAKVFTHPLVRLVEGQMVLPDQKITQEDAEKITSGKVSNVSWVQPETFVNVLMNIIKVDADRELFGVLLNSIDAMPSGRDRRTLRLLINRLITTGDGMDELHSMVDGLEDEAYRNALQESLAEIDDEIGKLGLEPDSIISVMAGLRKIKNPYFRNAMETILSTSRNMLEAEEKLGKWFEDGMSRATEAFSRRMQHISLIVGILIALVVNVDSLHLGRTLWENPILREGVATVARETDLSTFDTSSGSGSSDTSADTVVEDIQADAAKAQATFQELVALNLPIGWQYEDLSTLTSDEPLYGQKIHNPSNLWNYFPANNPTGWLSLLAAKLIGCLATMIAIAQGAPFWFNLLRRITG